MARNAVSAVLPCKKNCVLLVIVFQMSCANCWVFNDIYAKNNKALGDWNSDEGVYPIPYEMVDFNEINEEDPPDPPREKFVLTMPGTKWCGPGNIAMYYNDLGPFNETDKCCRTHDLCPDIIPAGHTAHGLQNDDFYTKLNCKCDEKFYKCLRESKDGMGDNIGKLYFNVIGTQCFRSEHPIIKCLKYRGLIRQKCLDYEFDLNKEKLFQWFDVPPYE